MIPTSLEDRVRKKENKREERGGEEIICLTLFHSVLFPLSPLQPFIVMEFAQYSLGKGESLPPSC